MICNPYWPFLSVVITVITAFCYDCVNDCAPMSCCSKHQIQLFFTSSICTVVSVDSGRTCDQKCRRLCSMSSNKICDAFFLLSHFLFLGLFVQNTESNFAITIISTYHSAFHSVLGQDTEPLNAPDGCVWVTVLYIDVLYERVNGKTVL